MIRLYNKFFLNEYDIYIGIKNKVDGSVSSRKLDKLFMGFHKNSFFDRDIPYEICGLINKTNEINTVKIGG